MVKTFEEIQHDIKTKLLAERSLLIGESIILKESYYYSHQAYIIIVGAYFTTKLTIFISVVDTLTDQGKLLYFESSFLADDVMRTISGTIIQLFSSSNFRSKRRIILDTGTLIATLLYKVDESLHVHKENDEMKTNTLVNIHNVLFDVDWIEEKMQEWYLQNSITDYVMVPFH